MYVTEFHFENSFLKSIWVRCLVLLASRKEAAEPASHTRLTRVGAVLSSKNWELCTRQAAAGVISHFWRVDLMGLPVPYIMDPCWIEKTNSSGYLRKVCQMFRHILHNKIFFLWKVMKVFIMKRMKQKEVEQSRNKWNETGWNRMKRNEME